MDKENNSNIFHSNKSLSSILLEKVCTYSLEIEKEKYVPMEVIPGVSLYDVLLYMDADIELMKDDMKENLRRKEESMESRKESYHLLSMSYRCSLQPCDHFDWVNRQKDLLNSLVKYILQRDLPQQDE
jgi:hypothetical protein